MDRVPITRAGYNRLRIELKRLEREERPKVINAIAEARAHGDISENAEYEAAKDKQGMIEAKINDLHQKLSQCEVEDLPVGLPERVIFGSIVVIENLDTGEEAQYSLVGPYEADLEYGTISVTSPMGRALIGKEPGDEVRVQAPGGVKNYEITDLFYGTDSDHTE